jgi:hypothetical protein
MDILSLLTAMTATGVISVAAAQYLSKRLLDHRLSKDLKDYDAGISERLARHKADLDKLVNDAKAENEARLKKDLEEYLGERSVERNYRAEARKRLYVAVGPLRFQLLVAAAEFANRVSRIGDGKYAYDMSLKGYFGQSTAYRMLRVLAVSELIERQIAYADFAVDPEMRSLLKFKRQAFLALSSHRVSLGHPQEDWNRQDQHVFYDVLGIIASAMITQEGATSSRVLRFDEFASMVVGKEGLHRIDPIPRLVADFSVESKPILWLRFMALAQLCIGLLETQGSELGLEREEINIDQALDATKDVHLREHRQMYREGLSRFRAFLAPTQGNGP